MRKNVKQFLYRMKAYATTGHGSWLGFFLSVGTFSMVLYQYGIQYIPFFKDLFVDRAIVFISMAIPLYIFIAGLVGFWAYRDEGAEPISAALAWEKNPAYRKLIAKIEGLEKNLEELQKMFVEYIKRGIT